MQVSRLIYIIIKFIHLDYKIIICKNIMKTKMKHLQVNFNEIHDNRKKQQHTLKYKYLS
jgi:hypothetical protein